jgi:hypothetical protein
LGFAFGNAGNAVGTIGRALSASSVGFDYTTLYGAGIWGDSGSKIDVGALATADDSTALIAANYSTYSPTVDIRNYSTNAASELIYASTFGGGDFTVFDSGTVRISDVKNDQASFGDPSCGPGFMAIQLGQTGMTNCNNYTLLGSNDGNTYLNSSGTGLIHIRHANFDLATIDAFGNMNVVGNLSKGGGSFKIDHPLDPANKYLYHSFVESPDMMNVYNGNIVTDVHGWATVQLPDYFEALNRDFRYQLTVIGQFAQAIVQRKVENNRFTIRTSKPGVEVSWQVTGIRQDAWANAHRIPTEVEKSAAERGHYLHPELFGAPEELRAKSTKK